MADGVSALRLDVFHKGKEGCRGLQCRHVCRPVAALLGQGNHEVGMFFVWRLSALSAAQACKHAGHWQTVLGLLQMMMPGTK